MEPKELQHYAESLYEKLRLRTHPVAAAFFNPGRELPPKTRRPSQVLQKRITICQGMTLARNQRWTVGLGREDMICVPAAIVFGYARVDDPRAALEDLFNRVDWTQGGEKATSEVAMMNFHTDNPDKILVLSPLFKGLYTPDSVAVYGNPAQIMRLVQAWTYVTGERVESGFGGKVECSEYIITPLITQKASVVVPGNGERIFAMTQDNEMVFAFPGSALPQVVEGLEKAGQSLGAKYPVSPYQLFQPEFNDVYAEMAKEIGLLD